MPLTSYRIYLGVTLDVTFSDEKRAELALIHLVNRLNRNQIQYQAMVAIDQLSAYIATEFEKTYNDPANSLQPERSFELQGVGLFEIDSQNEFWCCYREDFGSVFIQIRSPLSVLGIGSS